VKPPFEPPDTPYVLRLKSGVVRSEEGVELFLGAKDGECDGPLAVTADSS